MTDLPALLARVEAATGGDRALAREIQCTIGGWHRITPSQGGGKNGSYIAPEDWIGCMSDGSPILDSSHGTTMHRDVPDVTTSLDATVALVEKLRPKWNVVSGHSWMHCSSNDPTLPAYFCEMEPRPQGHFGIFAYGRTEPLARLAALLRSMIEEEGR